MIDLSDLLGQCRVFTAEQSTSDALPAQQPAIYAFFDLFRFSTDNLIDDVVRFKTRHARKHRLTLDEWPEYLRIRLRGDPTPFVGQGKDLCRSLSPPDCEEMARYLLFLSLLNEPLYVGKTEDIKARFVAHHSTGFLFHMKDVHKRSPDEFLFFACYCNAKLLRPMESILLQLINPPLCRQRR